MLLKSSRVLTSFCLAVFLCLLSVNVYAETSVVARVGSVPITEFELNQKLQKLIPLSGSYHGGVSDEKISELRSEALTELIEKAYMVQYAIAEELVVPSVDVAGELNRIKSQFKSDVDFNKALGRLTVQELRAAIYRKLLAEKALKEVVADNVKVSDADIEAYYQENKERFKRPRQFKASHILVKIDPSSEQAVWKDKLRFAEELFRRAKAGEDFYDLAYYNSDDRTKFVGGDLGYFHEGQMLKEFDDALLRMEEGEIAGPVKTLYGYHIIKLVEYNPPQQLSLEDMKSKLLEIEKNKKYESLKGAWLKKLKVEYKAEIFSF